MKKIEQILHKLNPNIDLKSDDFIGSGMLDSFTLMALIEELEIEFSIDIFDDEIDIENFSSLDKIKHFLQLKGVAL